MMSFSREIKQLQKAKIKAQSSNNIKEEANLCNQLGELLSRNGQYDAAIEEHQQELALSEVLNDVIGRAVANRKIGECFAEMGNIKAALEHQRCHLDLACSVRDHAEEQRALATIGRTFLFRFESDHSRESLKQAEDAFRKSLAIVDERLEGTVPARELSEMRARLFLNLGLVCDHLGEAKLCSNFIRRSVFIAEKNQLLEDLYRANFNLGNIYFRNGQPSNAVRCLEQAKECARKIKDKFSQSECFHCIGKVQLSLGDFVAARRSLKKAFSLGSQQQMDREAVKKAFKQAIRGCQLEEAGEELGENHNSQKAVELAEHLGDLYCKVGCYRKALDAYQVQLSGAKAMGKPSRELAVIHVSLAATYTDLRQHDKAVEHYRQELALRQGSAADECSTWLNIAASQEESGCAMEEVESSYSTALHCAQKAGQAPLQKRVLRLWLLAQKRGGSSQVDDTEARLKELCASEGWNPEGSDEEEEEEMENSESLEDSDIPLSDSDDDLEGYDKMVSGKRKTGRWNKRNEKGETSLHRACIDGNLKQVQYLVEQGHPVNPRDYCGWTPLHEAANHGFLEIVEVLLERGANTNDPGGPLCEGVTPLHDALTCGHFPVARLLVERGASVTMRNSKGETPLDSLRQWQRMYSRELDQEARQECVATERLLRKAIVSGAQVSAATVRAKPFDTLQDSQLFDAENSEPLLPTPVRSRQDQSRSTKSPQTSALPPSPTRGQSNSSARRQRGRGMGALVLYGDDSSGNSSDDNDLDTVLSPLRPVRPRLRFPASTSLPEVSRNQEVCPASNSALETAKETPVSCVFAREEYHSAIRGLGSAKARLVSQGLSQPQFSSTPAVSSNGREALIPEEEDLTDDWLEDDLGNIQPRKKRKVGAEDTPSWCAQKRHSTVSESANRALPSSSRGLSLRKGLSSKPRQAKMTQLSGMVMLGRREVSTGRSPNVTDDDDDSQHALPQIHTTQLLVAPAPIAAPFRMRVKVQDKSFLIPIPHNEAEPCTVSWLCEEAAQRYYKQCGLLPRLSLQKEGALLSPQDQLLAVLSTNEEVFAEVSSWDLPPLPERYHKACLSLAVEENKRVTRLCEAQDGSPSVSVSGLSLAPSSLSPLLRALKLQTTLTELRLAGNRLHDNLLPELVVATRTMPHLRLLDLSSNCITGEGLKQAANTLDGQTDFPCLEELDLSGNSLGDTVSQSLACVLSACPLLARLSLQACGLTARFLQQHRLLLASALAGTGHLKSVRLSHNALGSTGFELVLKTLPLHCLRHLELSSVRGGPGDQPALEHLATALSQEDCSLSHLGLAGNGLTDSSVATLARCLPACPSLLSLNLSGNPSVTSAGLHSLLACLKDAGRHLTLLNLQGCQVSGPWDSADLEGLSGRIRELNLCSQGLNKLDRQALQQCWGQAQPSQCFLSRDSKCLLASAPSS